MTYQIVCDDSDQVRWKKERRKLFTASDMVTLLGIQPDFFDTTLDEVVQEKVDGEDRIFAPDRLAAIEHGKVTEAANLEKCSKLFGIPVAPFHFLVKNERWPYLGATLDGIGVTRALHMRNVNLARQHKSPTTKGRFETYTKVDEVRRGLEALQRSGVETIIVEMKNTEAHMYKKKDEPRAWIEDVPAYLLPQVQTQMAIMELDHCLLCAQLGAGNMTGYLVHRDPDWGRILDEANTEAFELLGGFLTPAQADQEVRIDL